MFRFFRNEMPNERLWETILLCLEDDFIKSIKGLKIKITSSRNKYISQLFTYF